MHYHFLFVAMFLLLFFPVVAVKGQDRSGDFSYEVIRIKSKGDYYEIHARRNDSLFKIMSKKVDFVVKDAVVEKIRKGMRYNFDLGTNPTDTLAYGEPLEGSASPLHVKRNKFFGDTRIKFSKRFHNRIYTANNLIGKYYINR